MIYKTNRVFEHDAVYPSEPVAKESVFHMFLFIKPISTVKLVQKVWLEVSVLLVDAQQVNTVYFSVLSLV